MKFIECHEDGNAAYTAALSHGRMLREVAPGRNVTARPYAGGFGVFLVASEGDDK